MWVQMEKIGDGRGAYDVVMLVVMLVVKAFHLVDGPVHTHTYINT